MLQISSLPTLALRFNIFTTTGSTRRSLRGIPVTMVSAMVRPTRMMKHQPSAEHFLIDAADILDPTKVPCSINSAALPHVVRPEHALRLRPETTALHYLHTACCRLADLRSLADSA